MSDPEEDRTRAISPKSKNLDPSSLMDFDLDVCWPLDQIQFLSNPTSPFLFSPADHPCSPLWAFSDVNDDKLAGGGHVAQALPDRPQFVPGEFFDSGSAEFEFGFHGLFLVFFAFAPLLLNLVFF